MIIQNSSFTAKAKIKRLIYLILVASICVSITIWNTILSELGIYSETTFQQKTIAIIVVLILYAVLTWLTSKKKLNYIYFTDEDKQNIVFRFYHLKIFGNKYTTYKIPINVFEKYEIIETPKVHEIHLFQKVKNNKSAKYPPISITALNREEIENLKATLDTYSLQTRNQ